jgi:hypothetical protein
MVKNKFQCRIVHQKKYPPELIIINYTDLPMKTKLGKYLRRCGNKEAVADVEIGFVQPSRNIAQHDNVCL